MSMNGRTPHLHGLPGGASNIPIIQKQEEVQEQFTDLKLPDGNKVRYRHVATAMMGDKVIEAIAIGVAHRVVPLVMQTLLGVLMQQGVIAPPKEVALCTDPNCPDKDKGEHSHVEVSASKAVEEAVADAKG